MRSIVRIIFSWLIVLALFTSCSGKKEEPSNKKDDSSNNKDSKPADKGEGEPIGKPEFTMTAAELFADYTKDAKAAKEKYQKKVIELTGLIVSGGYGNKEEGYLSLGERAGVACATRDSMPWLKAAPGQSVTIRGRCESLMVPQLKDCEIIAVTGPAPLKFTAEEFSKTCTADIMAAQKKFDRNKFIIITGEIEEITADGILKEPQVRFKTPMSSARVTITFDKSHEPWTKKLMKGQQFSAMGRFPIGPTVESLALEDGLLMK